MTFAYKKVTPQIIRPIIPIILKSDGQFVIYSALIDSGADYCIFSIEIARALNLRLEKQNTAFVDISKKEVVGYRGIVEIRIENDIYDIKAIFADISEFGYGILGQKGFFDHFDVKLSYNRQTIEIERIKTIN